MLRSEAEAAVLWRLSAETGRVLRERWARRRYARGLRHGRRVDGDAEHPVGGDE